jgi:hypothetical protein
MRRVRDCFAESYILPHQSRERRAFHHKRACRAECYNFPTSRANAGRFTTSAPTGQSS